MKKNGTLTERAGLREQGQSTKRGRRKARSPGRQAGFKALRQRAREEVR